MLTAYRVMVSINMYISRLQNGYKGVKGPLGVQRGLTGDRGVMQRQRVAEGEQMRY